MCTGEVQVRTKSFLICLWIVVQYRKPLLFLLISFLFYSHFYLIFHYYCFLLAIIDVFILIFYFAFFLLFLFFFLIFFFFEVIFIYYLFILNVFRYDIHHLTTSCFWCLFKVFITIHELTLERAYKARVPCVPVR